MSNFFFNTKLTNAGGIELAEDLDWPSSGGASRSVVVDTSGGLTTVLDLQGKYIISNVYLNNQINTSNATTIKLTVDGEVAWNAENFTSSSSSTGTKQILIGDANVNTNVEEYRSFESILCNSRFLLEIENPSTSLLCTFHARPIK